MPDSVILAELTRGDLTESIHRGHAVIVDEAGQIVEAWGDPSAIIYPRSSAKLIQALPLVESGAANGLSKAQLALACASHEGADIHTSAVRQWLADMGLGDVDLRCGPQMPPDRAAKKTLICAGTAPSQAHNNCSGKHTGFLTLNRHLGGGPEYVDPKHPVQLAVRQTFEDITGEDSPCFGIDGCSAPNFACSLHGLARAMAGFAAPDRLTGSRRQAVEALLDAIMANPLLVAGEGRACTELIRACDGRAIVKTGAEGVFVAILPQKRLGIAVKIEDGATRAAEAALSALLIRHGALPRDHPAAQKRMNAEMRNRAGLLTGHLRAAEQLFT